VKRGLLTLVLAAAVAVGCGGSSEPRPPDAAIVAEGLRFDTDLIDVSAGNDFTILVDNRDQSTFHNFHITDAPGEPATDLAAGPNVQQLTFQIGEPGTYTFICDTHPAMTGTVNVSEG
jgi:plastocyanin